MNNRIKKVGRTILFFMIGIMIFIGVQNVLIPGNHIIYGEDNILGGEINDIKRNIQGLDCLDNGKLDVLFLGSSLVYNGVSPMLIYENTNIVAYSLASAKQPLEVSYFLLKNTYQKQRPQVVFLEASSLFREDNNDSSINAYWRMVMEAMPFSNTKFEMMEAYDAHSFSDGKISVLFPIVKYHSRWTALGESDFATDKAGFLYSAGETMAPQVLGANYTYEDMDYWTDKMKGMNIGKQVSWEDGSEKTAYTEDPVYSPEISDECIEYLEKLVSLCKENNTQLILFKIPSIVLYQYNSNAWSRDKSRITSDVAERMGIKFLDMMYGNDVVEIDFAKETADGGDHLNVRGAQKVSEYLSLFLQNNYSFAYNKYPLYDESLERYHKAVNCAMLETETDFYKYMDRLIEIFDSVTICLSSCSDCTAGLDEGDYELLDGFGLQLLRQTEYMDSYVAVISGGKVEYEACSNRRIDYTDVYDGKEINISSSGWLSGAEASILIDGISYALNGGGMNIVVIDNETGIVIDTVCFDTFQSTKPCYRNNAVSYTRFIKYIEALGY